MSIFRCVLSLIAAIGATSALFPASPPSVMVEFTLVEGDGVARPADRAALLFGQVVFRACLPQGSPYAMRWFRVEAEDSHTGVLCRSAQATPDTCAVDFGREIRRRNLTFRSGLTHRSTGERLEHAEQVSTLRAEPGGGGLSGGTIPNEYVEAASHPPDQVMRAVRVGRLEGHGARRRRVPVTDLAAGDFFAAARGLGPVEITDVRAPDPRAPCTIILAWSVSSHLRAGHPGVAWSDDHAPLVHQVRGEFEAAARRGLDCDCLVVEFAATARPLYGPFRLHAGAALPEPRRAANRRILDGLVAHLLADPPEAWARLSSSARRPAWESDFLSVYYTLNDLLRGTEGLAQVLVLTDGRDAPTRRGPRFLTELWPSRIDALNQVWSGAHVERLLAELDDATTGLDRRLSEFVGTLDPADPAVERKIASARARLDPGGLASLQTHRRNVFPNVDVLLLSSARQNHEDLQRYQPFEYGRPWRLVTRPEPGPDEVRPAPGETAGDLTLAEALLAARELIRTSYVVELLVPNPRQDAGAHELKIDVFPRDDRQHGRLDVEFFSAYRSSVPLSKKMPVYAASPFKRLRLLAAYAFREQAFDETHVALLEQRLAAEQDDQVRAVLFESWISIQFQRLQAGATEVRGTRARRRCIAGAESALSGLDPATAPDRALAAEARAVAAAWVRSRRR